MKKLILILAAVAINHNIGYTQGCLPEGITFSTQEQIDNFQTNYPICTEIEGDVVINGDDITNLNGLNVLTSIGGYLEISFNSVLTSLTGLDNLTSIGGLEIRLNGALTSLTGLDNLTSIGDFLYIDRNNALISLSGLENITSIEGFIDIRGNDVLISLIGLDNLISIGEGLLISENYALTNLTGLDNLTSIGGSLDIGGFYGGNTNLTSLSGLDNLISIGEDIKVRQNFSLTSLSALDNLTSIGGGLRIYLNPALTSLSGLNNIEAASITDFIIIDYNSSLSTCEVQSICDYLAAPNGTVEINDNAPGCNSQQEVEDACEAVGVEEPLAGSPCQIFPNPANNHLTIQLSLEKTQSVRITLLNVSGQQMVVVADEQTKAGEYRAEIDISSYPSGVYFCQMKVGNEVVSTKIVKY